MSSPSSLPSIFAILVVGVSDPDRNSELRGGRLAAPDPCLARLNALLLGGAHAHILLSGRTPRLPPGHRFGIRPFRLFPDRAFLIPERLNTIVHRRPSLPTAGRPTGAQFQGAQLGGRERRPRPEIVLLLAPQMPDQHGQLAGRRDDGNLFPAVGPEPQEEGPQGARVLVAAQAACTSMLRAWACPCLLMRPCVAG